MKYLVMFQRDLTVLEYFRASSGLNANKYPVSGWCHCIDVGYIANIRRSLLSPFSRWSTISVAVQEIKTVLVTWITDWHQTIVMGWKSRVSLHSLETITPQIIRSWVVCLSIIYFFASNTECLSNYRGCDDNNYDDTSKETSQQCENKARWYMIMLIPMAARSKA
jgi:hypothetical protein